MDAPKPSTKIRIMQEVSFFSRVDLHCINGRPCFGENTLSLIGGLCPNSFQETELQFVNKIRLLKVI